jgi:hypothetical protein
MRGRAALGVVALLLAGAPVGAAAEEEGFSLSVSPARTVARVVDGRAEENFRVANGGTDPLRVEVVVGTFAQRATGAVVFGPGGPSSAASWVRVSPPAFELAPGRTQPVSVSVAVPQRLEPGDHQIGITFVVPAADPAAGTVALNRGIGAQLLVPVPGEVVRHVEVVDLDVPGLADGGPVPVRATVRNHGNVHHDFAGRERLRARAGGDDVPFGDFAVLRESARVVTTDWHDPPLFCVCRVSVTVDDGRGGTTTATARVVVLPLRLIAALLLIGVGGGLVVRERRRRRRLWMERQLEELRRQAREDAVREVARAT